VILRLMSIESMGDNRRDTVLEEDSSPDTVQWSSIRQEIVSFSLVLSTFV
jgi:hypothetical protein